MVTFRNNNRRTSFRNNNRRTSFRNSNEGSKFSNNDNFQRRVPGRNNHNAVKLIEKYNDLAREALASGDKILSESYFQHADHFTRVQREQESVKIAKVNSTSKVSTNQVEVETKSQNIDKNVKQEVAQTISNSEEQKSDKVTDKKDEKKLAAS